jgi:L-threonylcarbamoyladenylate synthase
MEIIKNPTQGGIKKAAKALKDGHLVAFPTETVYGLGADATNEKAVGRIYAVKGRPTDHPLIVHISSIKQLGMWAVEIPDYAITLAEKYWPGPMTLILKRSNLAQNFITGNQNSVGLRVPNNSIALRLIKNFENLGGFGIAAPSANKFSSLSPTSTNCVKDEIGMLLTHEDFILDGGTPEIGIESTIIDCTNKIPRILRPGFLSRETINEHLKLDVKPIRISDQVKVPGQFRTHYSPLAKVVLDQQANSGDGFLALSRVATPNGAFRLASPLDVNEFAKVLYSALRAADHMGLGRVVVIQPLGAGLALAIRDRLLKASTKLE